MVKSKAINHINSILKSSGWGTLFGHSFRIRGASFYLSQKVDPEIVRIAGRWRSLAYEAYIRAFEQGKRRLLCSACQIELKLAFHPTNSS
jgi:hypothetical protein